MNPICTIGLCVKNNEATIKEAVNSIYCQDYPDELMEIIVVDGCSNDSTLDIIKSFLSRRTIKVRFFSESNGLGFARQMVVNTALGKYIIWVDGDIVLSKNYVQQQVTLMDQNLNVAIAVGSFSVAPNDNWVAFLENIGYVIDSSRQKAEETSKLLGTEGSILRVEAIRMVGGFDLNIKGAQEDLDVAYRLKLAGWKFYKTKAVLYERQRNTLSNIWKQHLWYGYGLHYAQHKNKNRNMFVDKSNDRILFSSRAYELTHRKIVFLLPFFFVYKKIATLFGFFKSHIDGYGHEISM